MYELFKSDATISILVIPKHVLQHVEQLVGTFVQNFKQCLLNFLLFECLAAIRVKLLQGFHHPIPDKMRESIIAESKLPEDLHRGTSLRFIRTHFIYKIK